MLAASNGRGGGDFDDEQIGDEKIIGRWAGDRIAIIGDYAEEDDVPRENAKAIYQKGISEKGYRDITPLVRPYLERELGIVFKEDTAYEGSVRAERDPKANWSIIPKSGEKPQTLAPDMILVAGPKSKVPSVSPATPLNWEQKNARSETLISRRIGDYRAYIQPNRATDRKWEWGIEYLGANSELNEVKMRGVTDDLDVAKDNAAYAIRYYVWDQPEVPPTKNRKVIVDVEGGVATVTECPDDVEVKIRDFDGDCECPKCGEGMYTNNVCPHCGYNGES